MQVEGRLRLLCDGEGARHPIGTRKIKNGLFGAKSCFGFVSCFFSLFESEDTSSTKAEGQYAPRLTR
jgi:hypothetical protein